MLFKKILKGLASFVLGEGRVFSTTTGGTGNARYCYSVWLRHLVKNQAQGLKEVPRTVAELGPGDSLGIGLAALISGVEKYYALDVVRYASNMTNSNVFDELVELFLKREDIPGKDEFPEAKPSLDSYKFPSNILSSEWLQRALEEKRIEKIRESLLDLNRPDSVIKYVAPWFDDRVIEKESVDLVYSQAVLEHVDELKSTYNALYSWLKKGCFMSHQIDFECHDSSEPWNIHWTYSPFIWKLIKGSRLYLLNREPYSTHVNLIKEAGFSVEYEQKLRRESIYTRQQLAKRYFDISDDDLTTNSAFIIAKK